MSSQDLDRALAALRQESRGVEAPPHVEAALRSVLRARASLRKQRPPRRWAWAVAAGITVLLGTAAYWKSARPSLPPAPSPIAAAVQPVAVRPPEPSPPPAPVRQVAARRPPRRLQPKPAPAPTAPPLQQEAAATDFLALEDTLSLPPIESAQVLRVRVPRSTLVRFGVPVNQDRMMEPIPADVIFAQDGIARAIRFVKY